MLTSQISWFTAFLALDEKRIDQNRNGCCCCLVSMQGMSVDQSLGRLSMIFELLGKFLARTSVQLLVMLFTFVLLVFGAYGTINLRMEFRPEWLVDPEAESMNNMSNIF